MFITHACFVLQELIPQSNFGDTLECVDWTETSNSVSFNLHCAVVHCCIDTIAPCCGTGTA